MISKKSVIYRFLCIWWVLINMPPRNGAMCICPVCTWLCVRAYVSVAFVYPFEFSAGVESSTMPVGIGVASSLRTLTRGLLLERPQGACPSLHPPCSDRGVRIKKIQLRKQMQIYMCVRYGWVEFDQCGLGWMNIILFWVIVLRYYVK